MLVTGCRSLNRPAPSVVSAEDFDDSFDAASQVGASSAAAACGERRECFAKLRKLVAGALDSRPFAELRKAGCGVHW